MEINYMEEPDVWDSFQSTSPQRSIFVSRQFLKSLGIKYDLVTCYDKKNIVAGAIIIKTHEGAPIYAPLSYTMYQGILLNNNSKMEPHSSITYEFKIVEYFIEQLTNYYRKICFAHSWRFSDMRPFLWHNYHEPQKGLFRIDLRYTGILDLKKYDTFEKYLPSIRAVRRQEFKKASKALRLETGEDEILFDELHTKTFERQGISKEPEHSLLIRSIVRRSLEHRYGSLKFAMLDDVPISSVLFLFDDRCAYYLFGANDPQYRDKFGGTFLLLQMIKYSFSRDLGEVDFVGVNSPQRGDYKLSFNAELKPYFITSFGF